MRLFFLTCSFVIITITSAQPPALKFEYLSTSDGLSHNKIQCILQDKQGYLWFGTIYGLNRYDGYTFKVFENIPGDSLSLANNDIVCLYQDSEDLIWMGTSTSSFSSYNPRTETFKNYSLPATAEVIHDFEEDENGLLWLATGNGLFSFNKKNKKILRYVTDNSGRENIQGILKDKNKDIFWLSAETGIRNFNKKTGHIKSFNIPYPAFSDISHEITHNIIQDRYGNIWMSTSDKGIYCLNSQTGKLAPYSVNINNSTLLKNNVTTQLMEDADGKIWVGSEGLAFFDHSTQSVTAEAKQEIPGKIRALLKDKSGIYWLGTERGIAKCDPNLYTFTTIKSKPPYTLQSANTILEDKDHKFWVGNYVGLSLLDTNSGIYKNENETLNAKENNSLFSSLPDKDGSLWFGSISCLFHIYKKNNGAFESEKVLLPVNKKANVTSLIMDANGTLWVGTKSGDLISYDPSSKTFKQYNADTTKVNFSSNAIKALHIVSPDSLLIGTEGAGLLLMHIKEGKFEKIKFEKNKKNIGTDYSIINAICEDVKKNIFIGTEYSGLWQTDGLLSNFYNYPFKESSQNTSISQVIEDNQGQIWLNTNLGLEIIDPVKKRFIHYSEPDGLSINTSSYLIKKSSGDFMRVDYNGLHIFYASAINLNKYTPPVYITNVQLLDKSQIIYNDTIIHLPYNEDYVSFDYVALNYTKPSFNQYAYKLDGYNKDWFYAGAQRTVTYTHLPPGTYTFEVKLWGTENPARLALIITPPWWRTWWFYALCLITMPLAIYIFFQYRLRQKVKALKVLEEQVASRTLELRQEKEKVELTLTELKATQTQLIQREKMASLGELTAGIAHEIQNPLNFVNNFSEVSTELVDEMEQEINKGDIKEVISLAALIKQNLIKIAHHGKRADAIVKGMLQHSRTSATEKEMTDMNVLVDECLRLSYHGVRAKDKSFNAFLQVDYDAKIKGVNIVRQDIGRVFLNLFNNAFYSTMEKKKKLGEAYEPAVFVTTKKVNGKVEIKIKDNGVGISPKNLSKIYQPFFTTKPPGQGTGLGLSLSYDIIKAHNGEINVETKENEFAEFRVQLPCT